MEERHQHDPNAGAVPDRRDEAPEDHPDERGAEGGAASESAERLPGAPAGDDDSALGDTDQHSTG